MMDKASLLWVGLFYLIIVNDYSSQALGFNAEAVQLLPLVGFLYFARKIVVEDKGWFWFGLMAGCALLIKQTAYLPLGLIWLYVLFVRTKPLGLFKSVVGALVLPAVFIGYFAMNGALPSLIIHLGEYARLSSVDSFSSEVFCTSKGLFVARCFLTWLVSFKVLSVGMFVTMAIAGYLSEFNKRTPEWWLGLLYTLGTYFVIKLAGWKDWSHYYLLFAPGIVLGMYYLLLYAKRGKKWIFRVAMTVGIFLFLIHLLISMGGPQRIVVKEFGAYNGGEFLDAPVLATWLEHTVRQGEKLLVLNDEAEIYYYSHIINQTHYGYYYLFALKPKGREVQEWLRQQAAAVPDYIVVTELDTTWGMNALWRDFAKDHPYKMVKRQGFYTVYKRS
jgi:hypothetical protein